MYVLQALSSLSRALQIAEQLGAEYDTPTDTVGTSRAGWARGGARGDEAQSSFAVRRGGRGRGRGCRPNNFCFAVPSPTCALPCRA